jgi:hypothetical protein
MRPLSPPEIFEPPRRLMFRCQERPRVMAGIGQGEATGIAAYGRGERHWRGCPHLTIYHSLDRKECHDLSILPSLLPCFGDRTCVSELFGVATCGSAYPRKRSRAGPDSTVHSPGDGNCYLHRDGNVGAVYAASVILASLPSPQASPQRSQ